MNADERAPTLTDAERALLGTPDDCACDADDPCMHHQDEAYHLLVLARRLAGEVEALREERDESARLWHIERRIITSAQAALPETDSWPDLAEAIRRVVVERDTLRAALQALVDACDGTVMPYSHAYQNAVAALRGCGGGG